MDLLRSILFLAYPICIFVVLFFSHVVVYCRDEADKRHSTALDPKRRAKLHCLIWCLQICLCIAYLSGIVLKLCILRDSLGAQRTQQVNTASLASSIAVFLYFAGGLLPDPDRSFTPTISNFHTWILATGFETALLAVRSHVVRVIQGKLQALDILQIVIESFTIIVLTLMSAIFFYERRRGLCDEEVGDAEQECLVSNGHSKIQTYGSTPKTNLGNRVSNIAVDAQSSGWLDYLAGFRLLFPFIWPSDSWKQQLVAVLCFLLLICQRVVNVLVPYQLAVLIGRLGYGRIPYKDIALYVLFRGLQGQQGVLGSIRALLWIPIGQSTYRRLTTAAYEHVMMLSLDFHLSKRIGEVMSALNKGSAINTFLDGFVFQLFPMVFDLGVAAVYLFIKFDPFYSLIVISVMWSYIYVTIYMAKFRGRARREMTKRDRDMDAAKTDAIMAYETVHHNCALPNELSKFQTFVSLFQKAEFSVLFSLNFLNAAQNLIFTLGVLLVCFLSAYQISINVHHVAIFVGLLAYFAQLQAPLNFFGSFYTQVQNNLVDAERMLDLFKEQPGVVDDPNAVPLNTFTGRVTFSNVSYAYDGRLPTLKNVSFDIEPGTSTAIVGESGSGKSTCLKLLFRFYNVENGAILMDNIDVRDITIDSVRKHISITPQDTILFNASLMYNMLYARPDASPDEVYEVCRAASIHEKIMAFPDGYDTIVGERGLRLSGGEKQRIAIARAILKGSQILLLDEATASLDSKTEKQIQHSLEQVKKDRTIITIAHRLSTITKADQILVFHEGRIVERGRHYELLALNGRYAAMWEKQTKAEHEKTRSAISTTEEGS